MKILKWLCAAAVLVVGIPVWAEVSDPEACTSVTASQFVCSLGDRDPYPFGAVNQRAELATDELYVLTGVVKYHGRNTVLAIDFCEHPWLGSASRKSFPFYFLDSNPELTWENYLGRKLTLLYRAKGRVELSGPNSGRYSIWLQPLTPPERHRRP